MKLFVDTGSIKDIEALAALGIIDGVTTNPSLLAKEPGDFRQNLKRICEIVKGPVSGEVTATDFAGMMQQGHDIAKIDQHMVVKVPLTRDGIKACKTLSGEGIRVNVTLCLLGGAGAARGEGGRDLRQPVRRPPRRHRDERDGAHSRDRRDLRQLRVSRPRCSSPAAAIRFTSSRPRGWAPTSARARPRSSTSCSTIPLTNIGLEKFLKDWEKAQAVKA